MLHFWDIKTEVQKLKQNTCTSSLKRWASQKPLPDVLGSIRGKVQFTSPIFWCYSVTQKRISQFSAGANPMRYFGHVRHCTKAKHSVRTMKALAFYSHINWETLLFCSTFITFTLTHALNSQVSQLLLDLWHTLILRANTLKHTIFHTKR